MIEIFYQSVKLRNQELKQPFKWNTCLAVESVLSNSCCNSLYNSIHKSKSVCVGRMRRQSSTSVLRDGQSERVMSRLVCVIDLICSAIRISVLSDPSVSAADSKRSKYSSMASCVSIWVNVCNFLMERGSRRSLSIKNASDSYRMNKMQYRNNARRNLGPFQK
jgi:hypothetical protein